jgi:anti-anti-sigma factor
MSPESSPAQAAGLRLRAYAWEDATVVECAGRLTFEHSEVLKNYVRGVIPKFPRVILDLKDVHSMDSAGLGAIVAVYISAKKANCSLLLIHYNKSIRNLLGLSNLLSIFESCAQSGMRLP